MDGEGRDDESARQGARFLRCCLARDLRDVQVLGRRGGLTGAVVVVLLAVAGGEAQGLGCESEDRMVTLRCVAEESRRHPAAFTLHHNANFGRLPVLPAYLFTHLISQVKLSLPQLLEVARQRDHRDPHVSDLLRSLENSWLLEDKLQHGVASSAVPVKASLLFCLLRRDVDGLGALVSSWPSHLHLAANVADRKVGDALDDPRHEPELVIR
mmetsp:Transcript_14652/g.33646  ORF Transcript_14652/g.33646 Transcript_14652/m.33646 type:complete len:212 (+) Transcript_14652:696-1331(+)